MASRWRRRRRVMQFAVRTGQQSIFASRSGEHRDRGLFQGRSGAHVELVAHHLAETTADTLVAKNNRCRESRTLDRFAGFIHLRVNPEELDRAIARRHAFVHTQLA